MRGLRILLVGRASAHESLVREALDETDRVVSELPADIVVLPTARRDAPAESSPQGNAVSIALGGDADTTLDAAIDAVWSEPPERHEIDSAVAQARARVRQAGERSRELALESIVDSLEARSAALRELLERETTAARALENPPRIGENGRWVEIEDPLAFIEIVRHEARRARREGTCALLFPLGAQGAAHHLAPGLRPQDVVLRRVTGDVALRTDVSQELATRVRGELGELVAVLPEESGLSVLSQRARQ